MRNILIYFKLKVWEVVQCQAFVTSLSSRGDICRVPFFSSMTSLPEFLWRRLRRIPGFVGHLHRASWTVVLLHGMLSLHSL